MLTLSEQVITGEGDLESEEEESGKLGTGDSGTPPGPLQGGEDAAEQAWESDTGDEGAGT